MTLISMSQTRTSRQSSRNLLPRSVGALSWVALAAALVGCEAGPTPQAMLPPTAGPAFAGFWEGSGRAAETLMKDDFRELTRSAEFDFWFVLDEAGNAVGEIDLTYDALLTVQNLPAVTIPLPSASISFNPSVGGKVTDLDPTRRFPLVGRFDAGVSQLILEIDTPDDDREPIQFTIQADPGVSAGIAGASVGGAGIGTEVIEIDMTPFSPFAGEADVRERAAGFPEARFEDKGDGFAIEWSARKVRD